MELWKPEPGEPEQLEWWRPLEAVRLRARADRVPSPLSVEEFVFRGRVDRCTGPAVWIYEHRRSGREMLADAAGRTYAFVRYRSGPQLGRFHEIEIWPALLRVRCCAGERPRIVRRHLWLVPPPPHHN